MSIKPLVQIRPPSLFDTDIALRSAARTVTAFDDELDRVVHDLIDTLMAHKIAVGLAAPQIGVDLKVAVINISRDKLGEPLVICNPSVTSETGKKDNKIESCMSIPGYGGTVERRSKLVVKYQTPTGESVTLAAEGFLARVISHEIDHLNGLLFIDRMSSRSDLQEVDLFDRD